MEKIRYSFSEKVKNILSRSIGYYNFMAYDKRRACDIIEGISNQLSNHVIKILILDRSNNLDHWFNEISAFVGTIYNHARNIKTKNRKLSRRVLLQILYEEPIGDIYGIKNQINEFGFHKYKIPKDIPYDRLKNELTKFYGFLVDDIILSDKSNKYESLKNYIYNMPELCK